MTPNPYYQRCLLRSVLRIFVFGTLVSVLAHAQVAVAPPDESEKDKANAKDKDAVKLPAFEVSGSKDKGYFSKQSVSGMKTKASLFDTPSNVLVIPRDLIDDIGNSEGTADTLKFVASGVNTFVRGENLQIRGQRTGWTLIDDQPDGMFFNDNAGIDTMEVLKGPQAVLYGSGPAIYGLVVKVTKKPQPVFAGSITGTAGSFGFQRVDLDVTGPLQKGFSYRIIGAHQESDGFNAAYRDDRNILISTLQWRNDKTTIRYTYDHSQVYFGNADYTNIIDTRGTEIVPYNGPRGWKFHYAPDWGTYGLLSNGFRVNVIQEFNENWQTKLFWQRKAVDRPSIDNALNTSVDFNTMTVVTGFFDYDENFISEDYGVDNIGKYSVGSVDLQSNFGYLSTVLKGTSQTYTYIPNFITASLLNPPDYNAIAIPASAKNKPSNRTGDRASTLYFLETVNLLKDRVIVNGGISQITSHEAVEYKNNAKRYGVLVKPTKDLALYYSYADTFSINRSSKDINGNLFPNVLGKAQEVGVKASLFNGRLTFTADHYWMRQTNQLDVSGLISPITGLGYYVLIGDRKYDGNEIDIQAQITDNWQLILAHWDGKVLNPNGVQANNTPKTSSGFYTRYNFSSGKLKGLSIGGGVYMTGKKNFASVNKYIPAYSLTNLFARYEFNKSWDVSAHVTNLFDKVYVAGAWSPTDGDLGDPRAIRVGVTYHFR